MTQLNANFDTLSLLRDLTPKRALDIISPETVYKYNPTKGQYENVPVIPGERGLEREKQQITDRLVGLISSGLQADLVDIESRALLKQREDALSFLERFGTRQETEWFGDRVSETTLGFSPSTGVFRGGMTREDLSIIGGYAAGDRGLMGQESSSQGAQAFLAQPHITGKSTVDQTRFGTQSVTRQKEEERLKRQSQTFSYPKQVLDAIGTGENVLSVIPLLSHLAPTVQDELLKKDPNFNAEDLLNAYANEDPKFLAFLQQTNFDLRALHGTKNLRHFDFVLNTHYANISMAESMKAYEDTSTTIVQWGHFAKDQAMASLGSIDFGGQILLAVATAGIGNGIALGATAVSAATTRTLSAGTQVARTVSTANKLARIGKGIKTVGDYLPLALPTTVMKKLGWETAEASLKFGSGVVVGHMITGFAEETMTDVLNQSVEKYGYGTRVSYDYGQMLEAGAMGALMEPILGLGFKAAFLPVTITSYFNKKYGWSESAFGTISTKVFNVNPARIKELALYRQSIMPNQTVENMSLEERELFVATNARMIAIESLLNEATGNAFGKIEDNASSIGLIQAILSSAQADFTGNQQTLVQIALQLDSVLKNMNAHMKTVDGKWQRASKEFELENPDIFTEDANGFVVFTEEGVETMMVAVAAESVSNPAQRAQVIAEAMNGLMRRRIAEQVKKDDDTEETLSSKVDQEIENDTDVAKKAKTGILGSLKAMALSFTLRTTNPDSKEQPDIETAVIESRSPDVVEAAQKAQTDVSNLVNEAAQLSQDSADTMADLVELGSIDLQQTRDATEAFDQTLEIRFPTAPEAAPGVAQAAPETTSQPREKNQANATFVANMLYMFDNNLISFLEVTFLLRKLAKVETVEQARELLGWMLRHDNKNIGKILELPMSDALVSSPKDSVNEIFSLVKRQRPELLDGIEFKTREPEAAQAAPEAAPTAAQAAPAAAPAAAPTPTAAAPATMDMARALETLQAHPELVKLLNIICK